MKVGIIGLGTISAVHTAALKKDGQEIIAVCDVEPIRLNNYNALYSLNAKTYADYREMICAERLDAVHICTPHYLHAEMIIFALEHNVNVLCEKPMCISAAEIKLIIAAEKKSNAILGVCLQNRYNASSMYAKEYLSDKTVLGGSGSVVWSRDEKYYRQAEWRGKRKTEGGGVMINQALHTLDLMQWLIGMPEYVTAQTFNYHLNGVIEVEDTCSAIYEGKGFGYNFYATTASSVDFPAEITIKTDEYIAILPEAVLINGKTVDFYEKKIDVKKRYYGTGHEKLIADFYACLESGKKFAVDGNEGAKSVKMILGAYSSKGVKTPI